MLELVGNRWVRRVEPGDEVRFGRGGDGVELALADDARLHRHCGTIVVDPDGWVLHNTGRWLRLRVIGLDRFGVDSLYPGQHLRVPWADSRVQVHVGDRCHEFRARFSPSPDPVDPSRASGRDGEREDPDDATVVPVRIDRTTGYFRALVALCEPQLRDPSCNDVATDLQIARRLNATGRESGRLSGKTVERRLDNCRTRFGLKVTDEFGQSAGLERRDSRRLLVDVALLTATVTPVDLAVLDDTPGDSTDEVVDAGR